MIIAGVNELSFEPKMPVVVDAATTSETPEGMRPIQGPLVNQRYKPTTWRYCLRLSAPPATGQCALQLKAGSQVIKEIQVNLNGVSRFDGQTRVDLAAVAGETPLSVAVVVSVAADAGIEATLDSVVSVEIPLASSGGC